MRTVKSMKIREALKTEFGLLAILFFLIILFSILSPYFLQSKNLLNITRQISVNFIVATGMTFLILTGEIDLSVGSLAALTGVITAMVIRNNQSIFIGIIAGLLLGTALGLCNGVLTVYGKVQSFIVTLAMLGIARGAALVLTNGKPISNLPFVFGKLGAGYIGIVPFSSFISLIVFMFGYLTASRTKHGLYFQAIGANREAAKLSAIPVSMYRLIAFMISGFLSSLGGIIITSRLLSAQPTAAEGMELNVIAAVILGGASLSGGVGTVVGTLIGSMIIGVIDNGMNIIGISAFFQQIVKGIIILVAVLARRSES
ncbi:MAG: ribose ABC transporter permease [Candidatus Atribacteria bacterium]|nr:ribose ABC transporter permease [Candidatus Atribacteria bacterium]